MRYNKDTRLLQEAYTKINKSFGDILKPIHEERDVRIKVTFDGINIGSYSIYDDNSIMQQDIAKFIFNDLLSAEEGEEGEDYDIDSIKDEAIEQSLVVVDAYENNTEPTDATIIKVNVNGPVESYNGIWTFEFITAEAYAKVNEGETSKQIGYDIDNRDISTTWLQLPNNTYVEVDPWELVLNALENAGLDEEIAQVEAMMARL